MTFTAGAEHIDFMGHVNNAVWLQWAQDIATAHWEAVADPAHVEAYLWVVTRHEIDYRGNIAEGESVIGATRIEQPPTGARFERLIDFMRAEGGKPLVSVRSTWAMIARDTGRLQRVPQDVAKRFLPAE
ncbi:acyl-CoA thioesterase [Croceicoccus naphthovorans]|nr:acyl-CoA thioesterase [Croceicoccus naphthovorans]